MNEIIFPLLIVGLIGLVIVLFLIFKRLDSATQELLKMEGISTKYASSLIFLKTVKYLIYAPLMVVLIAWLAHWRVTKASKTHTLLESKQKLLAQFDTAKIFEAPDPLSIKEEDAAELIQYGRDLIARTADYLGPEGIVKPISNGMNCQNCHLDAGTKPFGNNYLAVASTYPKFRARSGTAETIYKRINDCFQRSLNGQALDSTSHEMKAIEAYIKWLGQAVPKGKTPKGTGLLKLKFLDRPANPDSGRVVFISKCQSCHGVDGQGLPMPEGNGRRYPPLWGNGSFNEAAGLYRISNFAGYVKANMPLGATYQNPQLTDAEAWDVAAFINAQSRPKHPFLATDWPKIESKPFDHPFGPFKDSFPEIQHKLGPYQPIVDFQKNTKK